MEFNQMKPDQINEMFDRYDLITKALQMAKAAQTRYSLIKPNNVNSNVCVAGIRDNSLGKHGRNIIRFCYPSLSPDSYSTYSRIVINPWGFPNKNDLDIPVPSFFVTFTGFIQQTCEFIGDALFILSIVFTGARLIAASQKNENEIIQEAAMISAEYVGGYVGGGVGAKVGGFVGSILGPVGSITGAVSGSIVGSHYALLYVKSQEKLVEENTELLTNSLRKQFNV